MDLDVFFFMISFNVQVMLGVYPAQLYKKDGVCMA